MSIASLLSGRRMKKASLEGYLYIMPWLLGFVIFTAGPMIASLFLSFTEYRGFHAPKWTGFANFERLVTDRLFWLSLANTAYYTFIGVPLFLLTALAVALALNVRVAGTNIYRTIYYLPSVMPTVATAILWIWIFNPDFGFANVVMRSIHLPTQNWLADPVLAKPCLILMGMWSTGSTMLVFLAGLQGMPRALYEAAEIDGASSWARFRFITIPLLTPTIFFNLVMGIIGSFQVFATAFVATGGGPVNATLFYVLYLYNTAFASFRLGYASALAWVLFAIVLIFTVIQLKLSRTWVYYESQPGRVR